MLLSLYAQSTLDFMKDVTSGQCYLTGYETYCQLYEVEGSGLRAVCISDFDPYSYDNIVQAQLEDE
eukprot:12120839-Prorocentrum_lima.AAC.1